jgi:hypothetical protein
VLRHEPDLIDHWHTLSLDKRASGRWALCHHADQGWIVGMLIPEGEAPAER